MSAFSIQFTVTLPPIQSYPVRMAEGALDPVVWSFEDTQGNPISLVGKSITLTVYQDTGGTQVTQFTHSVSSGLTINQNQVTWTPVTSDTQTPQILRYILVDTTDGQELAWGPLSIFPV